MMNRPTKIARVFALLAIGFAAIACGGSKEKEAPEAVKPPAGAPAPPEAGDTPSDDQVKKDVSGNAAGILSVELSDEPGRKSWDSAYSQYFWEKWVTIKRNANLAEAPDAKLIVYGFARYEITGGNYNYREFKVNSNSYEGVPAPSSDEALEFVKAHMHDVFPGIEAMIVKGDETEITMPDEKDQKWEWDDPKSVSFNVNAKYYMASGNTEIVTHEGPMRVKIFRDAVDGPWLRAINLENNTKETAKETVDQAKLREMPTGFPK